MERYDFACHLPLIASMLNLFNKVVHFDVASGFDSYIESVEMYNYKSIPSGLIAARMTYHPKKHYNMNRFKSVDDTALDQLNHIIDTVFSSVENFEPFDRYTTLQSLYTAFAQLQDELMGQQKSDCIWFIVGKLWDSKLQVHMIEKE